MPFIDEIHQRLERGVSKDCWECGPTVSRLLSYESYQLIMDLSVLLVNGSASTPVRAAGAIIASTTMRVALPRW